MGREAVGAYCRYPMRLKPCEWKQSIEGEDENVMVTAVVVVVAATRRLTPCLSTVQPWEAEVGYRTATCQA